jgi:hypothetical protein
LNDWYGKDRRKPLVLSRARQVAKSTMVRHFAYKSRPILNEVNLERNLHFDNFYLKSSIWHWLRKSWTRSLGGTYKPPAPCCFSAKFRQPLTAIQALRHFYEEMPDLPAISAGSLLEFARADHHFSMPVGRIEYHHLGPMTFSEFLMAVEPELTQYIMDFHLDDAIPVTAYQELVKRQREFRFVEGMPEAVEAVAQ